MCCAQGDEYGHTRNGNNNWYGHDTEMTHFLWNEPESSLATNLMSFTSQLIKFRRSHPVLGQEQFLRCGIVNSNKCEQCFECGCNLASMCLNLL